MNEIKKLKKELQEMQKEAKYICGSLQYLRSKEQENSELYKNLFGHLNKLSNDREKNQIKLEKLREKRDRKIGYL